MEHISYIKKFLEGKQVPYKLHNFASAYENLHAPYNEGLATLLFVTKNNEYIAVLKRDDKKVNSGKLKKVVGVKSLNFCTKIQLENIGFASGAVSPLLIHRIKEKGYTYKIFVLPLIENL